tara:strand:+ start:409 stop:987 length:579 start_codon:yes stop_codon:yes gene_type:complete
MLVEAIGIACLVGLLFKGSLESLSKVKMTHLYIPIIAFALEAMGGYMLFHKWSPFMKHIDVYTLLIEILVHGLLCFFFYKNIRLPGMNMIFAGSIMNFFVILANLGYMPVDPALGLEYGYETALMSLKNGEVFAHSLLTDETSFYFLADIIAVPPPWPFPKTISIGDVFIDLGAILLIIRGMKAGHTKYFSV